ncbi:hypothetical protein O181_116566 [Austropuccinia psidii MF-1]|uniref:Retrovirus-related Pol polyprotein from transposon TNT 1-94-like beta-barrel domain-containing protein n=1 Tax=Austropuccinia psidii MF-1 TaxID=1389203 RepID=A0A9Q3KB05_9BASI|nr:hypothetical protein [Austropuccinia psidii MF-1]
MAYSILGKICWDSSQYDHVIDSTVRSINANINPQQVLNKLSELLRHKNTKRNSQKTTIKEENDSSALLTTSNEFPHKLTYICKDGKHNIKNTTHKAENCWAEHPELCPPPCNQSKKKASEAETHQTGLEALLSNADNTTLTLFSLVIDCGATHHMFNNRSLFSNFTESSDKSISTSNPSSSLICKGQGTVKIIINNSPLTLLNCLYVPKLTKNLVILLDLCKAPITITRNGSTFELLHDKQIFLSRQLINKLMVVFFDQPTIHLTKNNPSPPWHSHLGHLSNQVLKSLGLKPNNNPCNTCTRGKMTALPFKGHFVEVLKPLDCLHLDVAGPISPPSKSGYRYFLTIVDQYTSFKITRFLKNKSDVYQEFVSQKTLMENIQDRKIKSVSPPYTPEHNSFAERANQTILDKARCLLLMSNTNSIPRL